MGWYLSVSHLDILVETVAGQKSSRPEAGLPRSAGLPVLQTERSLNTIVKSHRRKIKISAIKPLLVKFIGKFSSL